MSTPSGPASTRLGQHLAAARKAMPGRDRLAGGLEQAAMATAAALAAYAPARALGVPESFWAAITAIAVVQTEFGASRATARDQFTGAAVGGAVGAIVALAAGDELATYALAVAMAIVACWLLDVASAARLAGSTVTIVLLVPHQGPAQRVVLARVGEVWWGVAVALAVVWLGTRIGARRHASPPR